MSVAPTILLDFALVLGGKLLNLGVVFMGGALLARSGGAAEYGIFAVATTWVLLGDGFIGGPFDLATVRFSAMHPGEDERIRRFEAFAFHVKLVLALIATATFLFLRQGASGDGRGIVSSSFPVGSSLLAVVGLLAARSTSTGLQNRRRFRLYAAMDLAQGLVRMAGFLFLAGQGTATATSYVLVYGLAALGAAVLGWVALGQGYLFGRWPSRSDALGILQYCGYAAGIVTLATLTGRGDVVLLASVVGAAGSATYALASQVSQMVAQAAMYASILTQPRVLALHRQGRLRRLAAGNIAVAAGLLVATVISWRSEPVGRLLAWGFGQEFAATGAILGILVLGVLIDWMIVPLIVVFCVQACPGRSFAGEALVGVAFLAAALLGLPRLSGTDPAVFIAWLSVFCRVAKMMFYGTIFFLKTRRAPAGAP